VSADGASLLRAHGALVAAVLALPVAGLALLLAAPALDVHWEHHPSHFWLVLSAGGLTGALAYATGVAARRRADARVLLVSLGFLAAAGFLGLHALATPGVLLEKPNTGFAMATPVGLLIAAGFAAASSLDLGPRRAAAVSRRAGLLQNGLLALLALWAAVSLAGLPPLDDPAAPERTSGPLVSLAVVGVGLYAFAVGRYLRLARGGPPGVLWWMAVAFVLLAEAMAAVAFGRNWHATWWEWHLLMLTAFALIAWSAHREWHEERFSALYLEETADGERELSVLFADLQGFTTFSETHDPRVVTSMLNEYFGVAIPPIVKRNGGDIDRIVGDALMATFNRRGDQPDHALRAARAALELQRATGAIAETHPGWPRFRAAVNTGDVALSVLGTAGGRTHTAIGDTVNLAARLEGAAPVGGVALGAETARRLGDGARTEPMGPLHVKGKADPVEAHRLVSLEEET
jgi:adenylate cyclase